MTEDKRTIHIQTVTITFAAEDKNIENLDALNERIEQFVRDDIVRENDETGLYDGVTLVADSKHQDITGTPEDLYALAEEVEAQLDEDYVKTDDGYALPVPKGGKEWLN